jgi:hypothetical protein
MGRAEHKRRQVHSTAVAYALPGLPDNLIIHRTKRTCIVAIELESVSGKCTRAQREVREALGVLVLSGGYAARRTRRCGRCASLV